MTVRIVHAPRSRPRTAARARPLSTVPTLRVERSLLRDGALTLAGMDEVGRGALGGPVSVGVVIVDLSVNTAPRGLKDSKLLTPAAREALAPKLRRWGIGRAVGHATAQEIDAVGIIRALRLAGERALAQLPRPDLVLLDGDHDWLTRPRPQPTLFDDPGGRDPHAGTPDSGPAAGGSREPDPLRVVTLVKADVRCAAVAAASVLAKTTRDALMVAMAADHPGYAWEDNKGYAAPAHRDGLLALGPCWQHRRSWNLRVLAEQDPGILDGQSSIDDQVAGRGTPDLTGGTSERVEQEIA